MSLDEPITEEELRHEFSALGEIFRSAGDVDKFGASAKMMRLISRYLSSNVEGIDVSPITLLLAEYAKIQEGRKPDFIKPAAKIVGKNFDPKKNMYIASISAAVTILKNNGYTVNRALIIVANLAEKSPKQIDQLRKDFSRREVWPDSRKFFIEQINLKFDSTEHAENHAKSLIMIANQHHIK